MFDAVDIERPADGLRILRAGDDKVALFPLLRRLDEEFVERRLAVGLVCT